ncbi:MAG: hypothetical protein QW303_02820 [Nitrososphaerota archaeon]
MARRRQFGEEMDALNRKLATKWSREREEAGVRTPRRVDWTPSPTQRTRKELEEEIGELVSRLSREPWGRFANIKKHNDEKYGKQRNNVPLQFSVSPAVHVSDVTVYASELLQSFQYTALEPMYNYIQKALQAYEQVRRDLSLMQQMYPLVDELLDATAEEMFKNLVEENKKLKATCEEKDKEIESLKQKIQELEGQKIGITGLFTGETSDVLTEEFMISFLQPSQEKNNAETTTSAATSETALDSSK